MTLWILTSPSSFLFFLILLAAKFCRKKCHRPSCSEEGSSYSCQQHVPLCPLLLLLFCVSYWTIVKCLLSYLEIFGHQNRFGTLLSHPENSIEIQNKRMVVGSSGHSFHFYCVTLIWFAICSLLASKSSFSIFCWPTPNELYILPHNPQLGKNTHWYSNVYLCLSHPSNLASVEKTRICLAFLP